MQECQCRNVRIKPVCKFIRPRVVSATPCRRSGMLFNGMHWSTFVRYGVDTMGYGASIVPADGGKYHGAFLSTPRTTIPHCKSVIETGSGTLHRSAHAGSLSNHLKHAHVKAWDAFHLTNPPDQIP